MRLIKEEGSPCVVSGYLCLGIFVVFDPFHGLLLVEEAGFFVGFPVGSQFLLSLFFLLQPCLGHVLTAFHKTLLQPGIG